MWRRRIKLLDSRNTNTETSMNTGESFDDSLCSAPGEEEIIEIQNTQDQKSEEDMSGVKEDSFNSKWAKYRAMKRAKEVLPNTPVKRVGIIQELANSPTCKNILEKDETFISSNLKRKLEVGDTLLSSVKKLCTETKKPRNGFDRRCVVHARRILKHLIKPTRKVRGLQTRLEKSKGLRIP